MLGVDGPMPTRIIAVLSVLILAGALFWWAGDSAAGEYEEMLQRGYAFVGLSATSRGPDGWFNEALRFFVRAAGLRPDSAEAQLLAGIAEELREDPSAAKDHYERAAKLAPSLPVDVLLGDLYLREGRLGDAEAAYRRALDIEPQSLPAMAGLARVSEAEGDLEAARRHLDEAVAAYPGRVEPHITLSRFLLRHDQTDEAMVVLETVRERHEWSGPYQAQLGLVYEVLGENEAACRALENARRMGENTDMIRNALARLEC